MKANLFFIITTLLWGLNYHWSKFMVLETSAFEAALWRYGVASFTLMLLTINNLPSLKTIKENFKGLFAVGFVGLFMFNFLFFQGMKLTSPINAVLIIGLNPALTLLFSALILKTEINLKHLIGILIALFGVLYLLFKGNLEVMQELQFSKGDLLIMAASVFFAAHHVFVKKYSVNMDNSQFSFLSAVFCLIPFIVLNSFWVETGSISTYTYKFWISVVGIGCFGTGLGYWLWYKGIEMTSAPKAAIFINIVPLSGSLFSIALGDDIFVYHFISATCIITGILIMQVRFFKRGLAS
jgi:drug/metabolite transporter (DMT)-like permease